MIDHVALGLQVVGACLAVAALVGEFRAARTAPDLEPLPEAERARSDENPWRGELTVPLVSMSPSMNTPRVIEEAVRHLTDDAAALEDARRDAEADWEEQQEVNRDLLERYRRILEDQRATAATAAAATRRRVVVEFFGVALVTVGTVLPDLAQGLARVPWPW